MRSWESEGPSFSPDLLVMKQALGAPLCQVRSTVTVQPCSLGGRFYFLHGFCDCHLLCFVCFNCYFVCMCLCKCVWLDLCHGTLV